MNCELLKVFFGPASFGICTVCVILQMISITALAAAFLYMMKTGNRQKTINIVKAGAFSAYANGIIAVAVCVIYRMYTGKLLIVPAIQPVFHGIFMMILLRMLRLTGSGNIAKEER